MSDKSSTYQKYVDDLLTCPDVTGVDIENRSGQQCTVVCVDEIKGKPELPKNLGKWPVVVVKDKANMLSRAKHTCLKSSS